MQDWDLWFGPDNEVDLNHLKVLWTLIETQSITRTGEILGLSQPAASRAVARLRETLGDPLLVRTSKGYVLTVAAEALRESVENALSAAKQVFIKAPLDPEQSHRVFHIGATDYGSMAVFQPLLGLLNKKAPHITLSIFPWSHETFYDIERGRLDFAVHAANDLPADFYAKKLFREVYVLVVRNGHPITSLPLATMEQLEEACRPFQQLIVVYPTGKGFKEDDVLQRLGVSSNAKGLTIPYFSAAPHLVASSDLFALLPARLAATYQSHVPISILPLPTDAEFFDYHLVWHKRIQTDPVFIWLKNLIVQTIETVPDRGPPANGKPSV